MRQPSKPKVLKKKATNLWSAIIRSQAICEAEKYEVGCSKQLQAAHIITRKRSATRTDLRNGFLLCAAHHRYFHDFPRQFSRFITTTWAQDYYETVYQKSIVPTKVNWEERVEFLKRIINEELTLEEARKMED